MDASAFSASSWGTATTPALLWEARLDPQWLEASVQSHRRPGPSLGQGSFPAPREGLGTQQPTVTPEVKGEGDPIPSTTIPQMSPEPGAGTVWGWGR